MRTYPLALVTLLSACAGDPLDTGRVLFNSGQYADARDQLERIDDAGYRDLSVRDKTAYCLYRGLVLGALGDKTAAAAWLGRAQENADQHPSLMSADDKARLRKAERQYGPLPATSEPPQSPGS